MGFKTHKKPPKPDREREHIAELLKFPTANHKDALQFRKPIPILYWHESWSENAEKSVTLENGCDPDSKRRWHCPITLGTEHDLFAIMDDDGVVHAGRIDDARTINNIVILSSEMDNVDPFVVVIPETPKRRLSLISFKFDEETWMVIVPIRDGQDCRFKSLARRLKQSNAKKKILEESCKPVQAAGEWTWCGVLVGNKNSNPEN